jgi:hypothetical protein
MPFIQKKQTQTTKNKNLKAEKIYNIYHSPGKLQN